MQKVFYDSQIPEKIAKEKFNFPELIMMENAATSLETAVLENSKKDYSVLILCGSGNNGGDGLALARKLCGKLSVFVYLIKQPKTSESIIQLEMAKKLNIQFIEEKDFFALLNEKKINIIVDCILGTGFSGTPNNQIKKIINFVNDYDCFKIACDVPTGLNKDGFYYIEDNKPIVLLCNLVITMGALKTCFFSDYSKRIVKDLKVSELGISQNVFNSLEDSPYYLIEASDIKLPYRNNPSSHKGNYGHSCVFLGEKEGAGIIASLSSLEFGSGFSSIYEKYNKNRKFLFPMDLMLTESIPQNTTAILLGCGFGRNQENLKNAFNEAINFIKNNNCSLVLDADAFYYKQIETALNELNNFQAVLTPHPKELYNLLKLCNLCNVSFEEFLQNRLYYCFEFSKKYKNIALISKSAVTYICYNEKVYIYNQGPSSLSKAGSGDVLAGMCLSLLAQGYNLKDACITSVYAHGLCASKIKPDYSLTPSKLIKEFKKIN